MNIDTRAFSNFKRTYMARHKNPCYGCNKRSSECRAKCKDVDDFNDDMMSVWQQRRHELLSEEVYSTYDRAKYYKHTKIGFTITKNKN